MILHACKVECCRSREPLLKYESPFKSGDPSLRAALHCSSTSLQQQLHYTTQSPAGDPHVFLFYTTSLNKEKIRCDPKRDHWLLSCGNRILLLLQCGAEARRQLPQDLNLTSPFPLKVLTHSLAKCAGCPHGSSLTFMSTHVFSRISMPLNHVFKFFAL